MLENNPVAAAVEYLLPYVLTAVLVGFHCVVVGCEPARTTR